jgi:hypothetical protein
MSPQQIAAAVRLRLAAELVDDLAALDRLAAAVGSLLAPAPDARGEWMRGLALAFEVERYYTGLEATMTRLLRGIDGDVPSGPASHREILRAASVGIDGGRPALISHEAAAELGELLKFRYLARHGYEAEPEVGRMIEHGERVVRVQALAARDLRRVEAWLRSPSARPG